MPMTVRCGRGDPLTTDLSQQAKDLAAIIGQVVHPLEETLLQHRSKDLVKLTNASGVGIELEKFKPKKGRKDVDQLERHLLDSDRGLQRLQQTRSVVDVAASGLLRALPEP